MNDEVVSWLLALEFSLPFIVLSSVLGFFLLSNQRKNKEAARNLILKIKNSEEGEKQAVFDFLKDKLSYEEDAAKQSSKKIVNERKFLFRNLISGLLDKNVEAIESLNNDLSRIAKLYHEVDLSQIKVDTPAEPEEEVDTAADDAAKLQASTQLTDQRREIKTLKQEVHITLTTLNNIFAEFSSMFGEEVPETEMSVDQIITAMESFSGKKPSTDAEELEEDIMADFGEDEPDAFAEVETELEEQPPLSATSADTPAGTEPAADFSLDNELDDIDKALEDLELGSTGESEPSWDEAFDESGDTKSSDN